MESSQKALLINCNCIEVSRTRKDYFQNPLFRKKIAESVLTDLENWIDSKITKTESKLMRDAITPIQRENDGIRSEIRFLAETMKHGFELMDQKMEFHRENLEKQISSTRENLEIQIKANKETMDKQFALQQKLLWGVLSVVLGLFAKAVHLF